MMKLILIHKDGTEEEFLIKRAFQNRPHGMNKLYYEKLTDETGKGKFINTDDLLIWEIRG